MERSPAERPPAGLTEPAIVVQRAFHLSVWLIKKVERFPRSFRYSVGDRLIGRVLDLLETLTEAAYTSNKAALLDQANRCVNALRLLLRLAVELDLLGSEPHEFAAQKVEEIGRMIGGWTKAVARRARE